MHFTIYLEKERDLGKCTSKNWGYFNVEEGEEEDRISRSVSERESKATAKQCHKTDWKISMTIYG